MRVCKLVKAGENVKLIDKHGLYAEVMGLIESPSGYKARLKFADGHRETLSVQRVRMLQSEVPKSSKSGFWDNH